MIPREIFTSFAEFQRIVSANDFWIPIGFQKLLHGYAWIKWEARSCTTTANRWLFQDSQWSLKTLWSTVVKVTKFFSSRYGFAIASPARCPGNFGPFTDLAISVFWEMSINTVLTQILTSFVVFWRGFMKRTGVRVSMYWNFIIHQISLNSCSHSGISEPDGLPRSIVVSSGCPDRSSTEVDTCTGEISLLIPSSRSRIWV